MRMLGGTPRVDHLCGDQVIAELRIVLFPVAPPGLINGLPDVVQRVRVERHGPAASLRLLDLLNRLANHRHVLLDPPVVVLSKFLQTDDAASGHRDRAAPAALGVGELTWRPHLFRFGRRSRHIAGRVMFADAANRLIDHLGRHIKAAVHGASQRLGLHHRQTQIVSVGLPLGAIIPPAILALRIRNQPQCSSEYGVHPLILHARHALSLSEHERGEPVVVHVTLGVGDVQFARLLGSSNDKIQGPLHHFAMRAASRQMAGREERERPHADEPQVVRVPASLASLIASEPVQASIKGRLAFGVISQSPSPRTFVHGVSEMRAMSKVGMRRRMRRKPVPWTEQLDPNGPIRIPL
jgi:hypothetical protein